MGKRHIGSLAPSRVRAAERRRQALSLRAAGADFRAIATTLGVSLAQAYADVQTAVSEITKEAAEDVLLMDLQRLDQLQASVWAAARAGDVQAVNTATKIIELRQRLFGNLRSAGSATVNAIAPPTPSGAVIVIGGSKSDYIAGLRMARGELPAPPQQNGNGNGHTTSNEWIEHGGH
jgi:siroheme synthase